MRHRILTAVVVLGMALGGGACASAQPTSDATSGPTTVAATASDSARYTQPYAKAATGPADPSHPRDVPIGATTGVAYPYDFYAHCGLARLRLDIQDQTLVAQAYYAENGQPVAYDGTQGLNVAPGAYVAGTLELLDSRTARFVIDTRFVEVQPPIEVIIYRWEGAAFRPCA